MLKRLLGLSILVALIAPRFAKADATDVSFDSGSQSLFSNLAKTALLTPGNVNVIGDGAVLQLGYYSGATAANVFGNGIFVPLTGQGGANSAYNNTSIGDLPANGAGAGTYALDLLFTAGSATTGVSLPAGGTPLAIRFYNAATLSGSTLMNTVSDPIWLWLAPATPTAPVALSLDDPGLSWAGGASTAFYTAVPVPEPSSFVVLAAGGLIVCSAVARRRVA